jgi:hypothetical protein
MFLSILQSEPGSFTVLGEYLYFKRGREKALKINEEITYLYRREYNIPDTMIFWK